MRGALVLGCALLAAGCPESVPKPTQLDGRGEARPAGDLRLERAADVQLSCAADWTLPDVGGNSAGCSPAATDYRPGGGAPKPPWSACISDDGSYHPFDPNISSVARVAAFEEIAKLLLAGAAPAPQKFVDAKLAYTQPEGLDSRVSRREDEHYPAPPKACADMSASELAQYKERCVGPAQIQPLLNAAFLDGAGGKEPLANAARIEAGLLWFLAVSVHKESKTCTKTKKDCDSGYAYYSGGEPRTGGRGLARYIRAVSTQAHDRAWDGLLAVRCWRDLDAGDPATDLALRDAALAQLDRALHRGVALIVRSRVKALRAASCGAARDALWAGVAILGRTLDREATLRDATRAKRLRDELAKSRAADADLDAISQELEAIFPCP